MAPGIPLSPQQQVLWCAFDSAHMPATQCLVRAPREWTASDLRERLQWLASLHDALRLTVGSDDGAPALRAGEDVDVIVREYEAAQSEIDRIALEQRGGGFDVRGRPQLRAALIRDGQASWLLVTACALFVDASSTYHFARQIVVPDVEPGEDAPAQSYLNYCLWQHEIVKADPDDSDVPFWALTDWAAIDPVHLPCAREPAVADSGHWIRRTSLPREDLDRICREEPVDAECVLFAAFQGFVCKLARTRELRMGYVADGRTLEELQSCLGLLAKTLPVHVRMGDAVVLAEQARQARRQIDAAVDWQDTFDPTDHARQPQEDVGHRVTFEYLHGGERPSPGAVPVERCVGISDASDLKLAVRVEADRIALTLVCRRASFDERSSAFLADLFAQWTSRLLAPGDTPVLRHGLLGESDARAVIAALNPQVGPSTGTAAVPTHEMFDECARRSPDAVAVVEPSGVTTYAQLATRSHRLAARLRALGLQPWDVIGIHLPRSADLLTAMLGVHRLGACHVLLDVQQPMGRNSAILGDAGAKAVVSRGGLDPDVAEFGLTTVRIDELPEDDGRDFRTHDVPLESPAYILYTSGSTGYPKGVTVSHRSLTGYLQWARRHYAPDGPCRALAHTSPAVDLSVTALLVPLISGGSVHVVGDEEGIDGLFRVLHESDHVGLLKMTPTHAALLVGHLPPGDYAPAKFDALVLGGENLNYEQLTPWLAGAGGPRVVNEYGPTEATVACCAFDVRPGEERGRVPIGGPIAGARLYVVDAAMHPVPEGVPGELLIAGGVLSDGYRNRPALTAAAFVPDPFAVMPGARAYHSGDLVAARGPLCLEYRGRLDRQVKIRGYRVELDEIEAVLQRHPDVSRAAVDLQFVRGDASIVAYVALNDGAELSARALRDFCRDEIAAHMVPNDVVMLDGLPLTRSGKVDLRALAREAPAARSETEYVAARDEVEAALVAIWENHVGKQRIGVRDNFFDLGGHSMMAIRILFDIRRRMQTDIDLGDIFDRPTIEALAARIRQRGSPGVPAVETWLQDQIEPDPANRHEPFTLTDVQQAYWVGQTDAYALGNVGAHVYQETEFEGLDLELLQDAFRKLIVRHDMMRVIILPDGRQQVLEHVPDYEIEIFDLRGRSPDRQQAFVREVRERMSHQVFDLSTWPLFAVCACLIDDRHIRLHLSFDALMADAWSFEILLRDFSRLYTQPEVPLPPLHLRFRDYVQATAGRPDSPLFLRAQSYWKDRIAALPPAPQLPMVKQLREIVAPRFERRRHIVGEARWSRIKKRAATAKVTPSALMLAAFAEVLSRWSRSRSFTLVLTVFNRPPLHPEIDEIVGDFTSLVLIELHASASRFEQRVQDVHRQLMERLEHRYFSGVRVLRELARQQADKSTPLMPVVFTSTLTHRRTEEAAFLKDQQVEAMGINQTPQIYLDHQLVEQNGELQFNWDSVDELFPPGMLDAMFEQYCAFVESLTGEPAWQRPPDLLPPSVMKAYATLNDTSAPAPGRLAFEPILEAAASRPDSPAIVSDERQISYAELVGTSWRIARALRARGVTPGDIVGILLEKGWEQVAAVLGTVFAGAAYVPIDPQAPADRIDYVMRDSGLAILITHSALRRGLTPEVEYLFWDEPSWFEAHLPEPLELAQVPGDLIYLIYTSGSTGRPKGVMIEHASVANRMHDIHGRFAIGPADRALGLTALHHDLSVFDIFGVLGAGAALVLPSAPLQRDPGHWTELMAAHGVTVWNSVPAFMAMLVEFQAGRGGRALAGTAALRVLLSGDRIPLALVDRMRQLLPDASLYSLGGPTETTVWDIWHPIGPLDTDSQRLPYGRPLSNARYYVLDGADRLCPVNVPGELCIAGQGLARGYWRDEQKTAARFVWHEATGERLYRSGDLGCLRPDGELDILGRLDLQVKIHGQRIELEEIELTLQQHPAVRAAAVAVRTDPARGPSLAAYLEVASPGEDAVEPPAGSTDAHGTLLNSIERIQFKMEQRGIRRDIPADATGVDLVRPDLTDEYLKALMRRRTQRRFEAVAIGTEKASGFLGLLMQVMPTGFAMPKYQYPSAGNAYPLQFYLLVRDGRIAGVPGGAYYYDPRAHRLVMLSPEGDWDDRLHAVNNAPVSQQAAFSLFVVCEMAAMVPLYGEKAVEFGLLEAGYASQLLMSRAPDFDLGLCPIGTMDFDPLRARLALGESHRLFHAFLGGAVAEEEFSDPKLYLTDTSKKWSQPAGNDTIEDVTAFLQARLPRHMIPDQFAIVPRLPYTSNGKVDRAALDAIELGGATRQGFVERFVEPRTDLQKALAGLWAGVLGIEKVGLHDDFFQLGGDSILAVQLMNRLKASFSTDIPLRDVLAATTVESLAALIERKLAAELDADTP